MKKTTLLNDVYKRRGEAFGSSLDPKTGNNMIGFNVEKLEEICQEVGVTYDEYIEYLKTLSESEGE